MTTPKLTLFVTALAASLALGSGCKNPDQAHSTAEDRDHEARPADACLPQVRELPPSGEGMWPWDELRDMDGRDLHARGLELRPEEIWTPGQGGLASAVVGLRGCTASFISPDGLMITNHHCAYGAIQRNSTDEKNLLETGFLAGSRQEELDGHGMKADVFLEQTDVTVDVLGEMPEGLTDLERARYIEKRQKEIVARCEEQPSTRCEVSRVNDGLRFVLLTNLEIRDVRIVAAPPESLGSYGGEVDNWHWPRHSMDFTLLRAYVGQDGSPASHHPDNVPYHPERWLEVSHEGVDAGDLVMVMGTPYSTRRYLTSHAIEQDLEWYYPLRVDLFSRWIQVLEDTCHDLPETCLVSAGDVRSLDNALTNARGMIDGLERTDAVARRQEMEKQWNEWVQEDPRRQEKWGTALGDLVAFHQKSEAGRDRDFLIRYLLRGSRLMDQSRMITRYNAERSKPDTEREPGYQDRDREDLVTSIEKAQKSLHPEMERRVLVFFLKRMARLPADQRLRALDEALVSDWSDESIRAWVDTLLAGTLMTSQEERLRLFDAGQASLEASTDTVIQLALALAPELDRWEERKKARAGGLSRLRPSWLESLIEYKGMDFYPDANATPRISFATVAGYSPRDGVWYAPFTTLSGIVEKNTGQAPFDAPREVLKAIESGDHGPWADPVLGDVPSCFLSNADTTGGNSGSPAVDGKGRLVGLNFDRVYENIAGDYGYDPRMSRNIMVDVRAVLWYLDRVLGAEQVMQELMAATDHHAARAAGH